MTLSSISLGVSLKFNVALGFVNTTKDSIGKSALRLELMILCSIIAALLFCSIGLYKPSLLHLSPLVQRLKLP